MQPSLLVDEKTHRIYIYKGRKFKISNYEGMTAESINNYIINCYENTPMKTRTDENCKQS